MARRFEIDTVSDDNPWVVLRRTHFYATDMMVNELDRVGVGSNDRRLLDALDYCHKAGSSSVATSALCEVVPAPIKSSTALSTLRRVETDPRGWVESLSTGSAKQWRWRLTPEGHEMRRLYNSIADEALAQIFRGAEDQGLSDHLFRFGARAVDFMNDRIVPILDHHERIDEGIDSRPLTATTWSSLRRVHFYLSDLIVRETAPMGVGMNERRVLDALGFAEKQDVPGGLAVATLCHLNVALTRQTTVSALDKAYEQGWVIKAQQAKGWLWSLTDKGRQIREIYKRYTQYKLREVFEVSDLDEQIFLELALVGQRHRDSRRLPIVARLRQRRLCDGEVAAAS